METLRPISSARSRGWQQVLRQAAQRAAEVPTISVEGRLTRMIGLTLEAVGFRANIGARCLVKNSDVDAIEAEVVGFAGDKIYLMPTGPIHGIGPNARVIPMGSAYEAAVSDELLGRVIDGAGNPLDGKGAINATVRLPLAGRQINPMSRRPIREPLDVGVRAINSILTVGRGQRMGLFAGSGVGKSVLLGMMTRFTTADVIVVGLIGERGREVKEFIENILGTSGMERAVVVAAPPPTTHVFRFG